MTVPELLASLTGTFQAAADPERAAGMAAYMRDQFPFLGIPTPERRKLGRAVQAVPRKPLEEEVAEIALACWGLPHREYQYFGTDYVCRHIGACGPDFLGTVERLLVTKPWWDTVDALAAHAVGPLVADSPGLVAVMDEWAAGPELWLARTAILHQLTYKGRTDAARLFGYCTDLAGHPDFFIRKAIGWSLREYAKTEPESVRSYMEGTPGLSPLSRREALKNL
ncbi:DNA alkylation repair protein [Longispora albida]|uniref:DNA alkylation repair protein n=1 Tax=Longispora albida TaxID=203523 RepID=UPI0003642EC1|nr:DNA alkylation repair protein [Longispora albida]